MVAGSISSSPASSAAHSPRSYSPLSENLSIDTPATERSLLFGQDDLTALHLEEFVMCTGGLGFIGSHTSLELLKAGYNVLIVDSLANAFSSVYQSILALAEEFHRERGSTCPAAKFSQIDFQDIPSMKLLLEDHMGELETTSVRKSRIIGVIHFAAFKAVAESIQTPLKYYQNNVCGLVDFLALLDSYGIRNFIFSSSATVYGSLANRGKQLKEENCVHPPESHTIVEDLEFNKLPGCIGITNPYGRTKWMCEAILADLAVSNPDWSIVALRYFNPIGCDSSGLLGEDPKCAPSNLLPVVAKVVTGEYDELKVFGQDWDTPDGTAIRDFIHVSDLAKGHIAALSSSLDQVTQDSFRVFNLGTGTGHSVKEVIETMEMVTQRSITRKIVERRAGDVGSCVANVDRARDELKWKTEKSLKNACEDLHRVLRMRGCC